VSSDRKKGTLCIKISWQRRDRDHTKVYLRMVPPCTVSHDTPMSGTGLMCLTWSSVRVGTAALSFWAVSGFSCACLHTPHNQEKGKRVRLADTDTRGVTQRYEVQ
jgi:hypothetical protein